MPLHPRRACIAFKTQSVAGTAETLTAAEAAFNAYEHAAVPDVPFAIRERQLAFGGLVAIPGTKSASISFLTDLYASPGWESMLKSCGMNEGTTDIWTASSVPANWAVATVGRFMDGKVYSIRDAMGTFTIQLRPGMPTRIQWTFTGPIENWGTAATLLAPTLPTGAAAAPRFAAATITLGGNVVYFSALDIAKNNAVTLLEDGGTTDEGFHRAWIGGAELGGTIDIEEALVATRDDHGIWLTPTEQALSIAYGGMSISIPKLQFINLPQGERNGASVLNVTWKGNGSASAGNDELVIDLST